MNLVIIIPALFSEISNIRIKINYKDIATPGISVKGYLVF